MTYNIICIQRMQRRYGITINYQFRRNYSSVNQTAVEYSMTIYIFSNYIFKTVPIPYNRFQWNDWKGGFNWYKNATVSILVVETKKLDIGIENVQFLSNFIKQNVAKPLFKSIC